MRVFAFGHNTRIYGSDLAHSVRHGVEPTFARRSAQAEPPSNPLCDLVRKSSGRNVRVPAFSGLAENGRFFIVHQHSVLWNRANLSARVAHIGTSSQTSVSACQKSRLLSSRFYVCNLMLYWCGLIILWKLFAAVCIGLAVYLICQRKSLFACGRGVSWFFAYLASLLLFSYAGAYGGGMQWIGSPLDMILILPLSMGMLALSQRCLPAAAQNEPLSALAQRLRVEV